jgi:hypothetical protein
LLLRLISLTSTACPNRPDRLKTSPTVSNCSGLEKHENWIAFSFKKIFMRYTGANTPNSVNKARSSTSHMAENLIYLIRSKTAVFLFSPTRASKTVAIKLLPACMPAWTAAQIRCLSSAFSTPLPKLWGHANGGDGAIGQRILDSKSQIVITNSHRDLRQNNYCCHTILRKALITLRAKSATIFYINFIKLL